MKVRIAILKIQEYKELQEKLKSNYSTASEEDKLELTDSDILSLLGVLQGEIDKLNETELVE